MTMYNVIIETMFTIREDANGSWDACAAGAYLQPLLLQTLILSSPWLLSAWLLVMLGLPLYNNRDNILTS